MEMLSPKKVIDSSFPAPQKQPYSIVLRDLGNGSKSTNDKQKLNAPYPIVSRAEPSNDKDRRCSQYWNARDLICLIHKGILTDPSMFLRANNNWSKSECASLFPNRKTPSNQAKCFSLITLISIKSLVFLFHPSSSCFMLSESVIFLTDDLWNASFPILSTRFSDKF